MTDCPLPEQTTAVQYVDDILIASISDVDCVTATKSVLLGLAEKGFKVSKDKLQIAHRTVVFLGRLLSATSFGLSPAHSSTILHHPKPNTIKDMLSFLDLTGFSRNYVLNYTGLTKPLRRLINDQRLRNLSATLQ